jgi:hypothetical protein
LGVEDVLGGGDGVIRGGRAGGIFKRAGLHLLLHTHGKERRRLKVEKKTGVAYAMHARAWPESGWLYRHAHHPKMVMYAAATGFGWVCGWQYRKQVRE